MFELITSFETMSRILPVPTRKTICRNIRVVLDMEDYPNPKSLNPYSISEKITSEFRKEGYRGRVSIWAYADEDTVSDELRYDYREAGILIRAGDKVVRLYQILVDMLFWARVVREQSTLLILSKNKKMEQDPNFSRFREALEMKGLHVVLARNDTLINFMVEET